MFILILLISLPFILYFVSPYDWKLKKLDEKQKEEAKQRDIESWKWLGLGLIILGFGGSLFSIDVVSDPMVRFLLLVTGIVIIFFTSKKSK